MQIGGNIWLWYSAALDTDVASTRLKLASMLYCKGELQMTAEVLEDVERRYDNTVQAICGCGRMDAFVAKPHEAFAELMNDGDPAVAISIKVAFCVQFLYQEAYCAPPMLHYEMVRTVGNDMQHRRFTERYWMDWAVVDARQFLHYLQYLAFRDLCLRHKQQLAFRSLKKSIVDGIEQNQVFHLDTAVHLFAHCLEIEGRIDNALDLYLVSQAGIPPTACRLRAGLTRR